MASISIAIRERDSVLFLGVALSATAAIAVLSNFGMLLLVRGLNGLSLGAVVVTTYSVVADLYPPAQRGRATSVVAIGEVGAAPAAFALGGVLLSMTEAMGSWRWALLWMCVPLLLAWIAMWGLREAARSDIQNTQLPIRQAARQLWRYREVIVPLMLARIMVWTADGGVLVWGTPTFARKFGLPPEQIGAIMATALFSGWDTRTRTRRALGRSVPQAWRHEANSRGPRYFGSAQHTCCVIPAGFQCNDRSLVDDCLSHAGLHDWHSSHAVSTIVIPGELRGLYLALTIVVCAVSAIGIAPLVVSGLSGLIAGESAIGEALAYAGGGTSLLGGSRVCFQQPIFPCIVAI